MAMCNCHGTGIVLETIFPGAVQVQPCDCPAASRAREKAERELREMLEAIRREQENTVAGLCSR